MLKDQSGRSINEVLDEIPDPLDKAKFLITQVVCRDGTELPYDIYILTRRLFAVLHGIKKEGQ